MQDNFPISQLLIQLHVPLKRESDPLAALGCLYMLNVIKESTQQATAGWHCCLNSLVSPISEKQRTKVGPPVIAGSTRHGKKKRKNEKKNAYFAVEPSFEVCPSGSY